GFFSQSDSLIKVTLSIVTSLGVVMLPHVSNLFSKGKIKEVQETLKKSFVLMTGLAIPIMFGVMGIALNFAGFFFGPKWVAVGPLLMMEAPIIVFIAWSNVLGIQYLLPLNRMREFTTSVTIGAVLNILLNFVLIPSLGLTGAMIATVIAEAAVTIYQFYILRNDFEIGTMILSCWKYFLSGAIMFGVVFYLNNLWKMNFRNLLFQIVIGAIIYIILNILLKTSLFIEVKKIVSKK
ncbi:polysaccharide biosynthesis C-terminal domain-containing protein, partial [Lactococcus lactis]